jgi:hypothetical protein
MHEDQRRLRHGIFILLLVSPFIIRTLPIILHTIVVFYMAALHVATLIILPVLVYLLAVDPLIASEFRTTYIYNMCTIKILSRALHVAVVASIIR